MNCWEILGIDPTRDRATIERAFEQQKKFASGEDLDRLQQAFREASGEQLLPASTEQSDQPVSSDVEQGVEELSASDQQVVREVVIQVKALLNDSRRASDDGIWRAILTEPPADQANIRRAVAQSLESQVKPMAENGSFPTPVVAFLGDWFGWQELKAPAPQAQPGEFSEQQRPAPEAGSEEHDPQPGTSFWPAVIGWIAALAVLAVFFDSLLGG